MLRPSFLVFALGFLFVCASSRRTHARSWRPGQIPNGTVIDSDFMLGCINCHFSQFGAGPRNPFGMAVELNFPAPQPISGDMTEFWDAALAALDSDGDGFTNGEELQDPTGAWRPGMPNPGDPALVTNPGDPASTPAGTPTATPTPTATSSPTPTSTPTPTLTPTATPSPTPDPTTDPLVGFCLSSSSIAESAANAAICVELNAPATLEVRVDYRLAPGGTATPGQDFILQAGTLIFPPGTLDRDIPIAILDDTRIEGGETVILELTMPIDSMIDALRAMHVLTIEDTIASDSQGLRIDRWSLKTNSAAPRKATIRVKGEFNDEMRTVDLESGEGIVFLYDGGSSSDTLAIGGFTPGRGAKFKYKDPTRKGSFLHRIGGGSRSKFRFISRGAGNALEGIAPMPIAMRSGAFVDEVTVTPVISSKGSKFNIAKNPYADERLYVDSLLVKRKPEIPDKDSIRLTLRFPGGMGFQSQVDTLVLTTGFFEITVAPDAWIAKGNKLVYTKVDGAARVAVKLDPIRRTLSLSGKRLNLPGPDGAAPEATVGLGFGNFSKANALKLQVKTVKNGTQTFRY